MAQPPKGLWECKECGDYVEDHKKECPRCKAKRDSDGYNMKAFSSRASITSSSASYNEPFNQVDKIEGSAVRTTSDSCSLSTVFVILSFVIWGVGLVAAIGLGRIHGTFNFWLFLAYLCAFAVAGCFPLAIAKALDYLAQIASNTRSYKIDLKKKTNQNK